MAGALGRSERRHAFTGKPAQQAYTAILIKWLSEMIMGAREEAAGLRMRERGKVEPSRT